MKALLVCSSPRLTRQLVTAMIGEQAPDYLEVRTPQRALAVLDAGESFDIVIADADTTPTGGFALSREVKARAQMGEDMPPVVLLVARVQDNWLAEWSEADAWILKPVDPFDLAEVVEALVARQPVPALPGVSQGGGAMREEAKAIEEAAGSEPGALGTGA